METRLNWHHTSYHSCHVLAPFSVGTLGSCSAAAPLSQTPIRALMIETETIWKTMVYVAHQTLPSTQGDLIEFSCHFHV